MGVWVTRTPMNPGVYQVWVRLLQLCLWVGVPAFLLAMILSWTGSGSNPFSVFVVVVLGISMVVFILANTICNLNRPLQPEEIWMQALGGTVHERRKIANWTSTPREALQHLSTNDPDAVVRKNASHTLRIWIS